MSFSGGSDRIVYEEQPQGSAGPPLPLSQANGGLGTDASALANGVLVKAGGVFATSTAPTMSGANLSSATVPPSSIQGGTSGRVLVDTGTTGAFTNTPVGLTLSGASNTFSNIPASTALSGQVPVANGGTGLAAVFAAGDLIYATGASTLARLGVGSAGQVLTVSSGLPSWQAPIASTVVSNTFSGTYLVAATTFANVGLSLVLPVGQWHVVFDVRNLSVVTAGAGFARLRLYDSTNGAAISSSDRQGILTTGTGGGTTTITMDLTISGSTTTIDLQAARDTGATYSACQILGDATDGYTHATAFKRAL